MRGAEPPRLKHVPLPPHVIEYQGRFVLPAPPDQVWATLSCFDRYEQWWGWLRELRVEGGGLQAGSVLRGTVIPPLPYRIRIEVRLVECAAPQTIRATVAGDLRGHARLRLTPIGSDQTRADIRWTIEMMQPPMRLVARCARHILLWGHDRVVDATVVGFSRHLAGDHGDATTNPHRRHTGD
jgi:uncharacterized protein YndB with AHSA1/START domain